MHQYRCRLAQQRDVEHLPRIERDAAQLFRAFSHVTGLADEALEQTNSIEDFSAAQQIGLLWVAVDQNDAPVGFAFLKRTSDGLHLHELDVHPDHGRRGVGRALLTRICEFACNDGAKSLTVTTYRDIPWNAPFYARCGFRVLADSEWTGALREIREHERALGWKLDARVAMQKLSTG